MENEVLILQQKLKESDIKLDETKNKLTSIEIERDNLRSELDSHKIEKSKSLIIKLFKKLRIYPYISRIFWCKLFWSQSFCDRN